MAARKKKALPVTFQEQLVLFRYFLDQFGRDTLGEFARSLNTAEAEGFDDNQNSLFYVYLRDSSPKLKISKDQLRVYDENICRHVKRIGTPRGGLSLKYFQYLSLLFTEIYLDRYFSDRSGFAAELNDFLNDITAQSMFRLNITPYTEKTLNKLAFMCATGSGKTLIMHINIFQFLHYLKRAQRQNSHIEINKIIVLAPNEMMALQHLDELELSGISADLFHKDILNLSHADVIVIDMNKLKEEGKVKTVSVDQFEQNNLVLVDEGHRGMSGNVWYDYRTRLSLAGFAFEYSATFKQALKSGNNTADRQLMDEYGKSIIMDYSYKYFYSDGYGKDYRIYNLKEGIAEETRHIYLVGCLVSYYQQLKVFINGKSSFLPYRVEKPLLVFVGNRVTATTSVAELTDVEEVLDFIDKFLRNKKKSIERLNALFNGDTGLVDGSGNELFLHAFYPLKEFFGMVSLDAEAIYVDMLRLLFNTETTSDEPRLHVEDLRQVPGEIALKVGSDGKYFGVISIGDTSKLLKLCGGNGIVTRNEEFVTESFFRNINRKDSSINVLIGSRKFTEGWNSWRVSTMGLINFAKGEGSQAIQLFGRGVRLRGYEGCLKRSNRLDIQNHPKFISTLETLTIFGIKAKYMEDFREYLENEEVPVNDNIHEFRLPVISRFDKLNGRKLHVLRIEPGRNFKKQSARLCFAAPEEDGLRKYLNRNKIIIDCRAKVQTIDSTFSFSLAALAEEHVIPQEYLEFLDDERIFEELEEFKNEKGYYNISIDRKCLKNIMRTEGLYTLIIPASHLQIDSIEKLQAATDYCIMVLKSYMEKFFKYYKDKWESPYLSYQELAADDPNFVHEYTLNYTTQSVNDKTPDELEVFLNELEKLLFDAKGISEYKREFQNRMVTFDFRHHLYAPLICMKGKGLQIQISPVSLNEDEKVFIDRLKEYTEHYEAELEEKAFYLLRNKSKAGIGFFEAGNFYPDYILWIDTPEIQYINFIDPKGLLNVPWDDPKILFYQTIKERQSMMIPPEGKKIILNSFIMSGTSPEELRNRWLNTDREDWTARNVMCLKHSDCVECMFQKIFADSPESELS